MLKRFTVEVQKRGTLMSFRHVGHALNKVWRHKHMPPGKRARLTATSWILVAIMIVLPIQRANAAAEDILAGAFDAITGVPFAKIMLGIVRSGESSRQSPEALDARLSAVEALLRAMEPRLRTVEERVKLIENALVKVSNINRLRTLQRIRSELLVINVELRTKPTDPGRRAILEFRARQQADLIKNDPDLDVWHWSDVIASNQPVRTRFFVYPSFEIYALAINTWFAAIEMNSGNQPQRIVADSQGFLREHQTFLETRSGVPDVFEHPVTLAEHMQAAAFCRLEAISNYSNIAGDCLFASICVDTMKGERVETDRQTLMVNPRRAGTLCTTTPSQSLGLKGEAELRNKYGAEVMAALAHSLARLASTGSLHDPVIGQFPGFIQSQIFSVAVGTPLLAAAGAAPGALPIVPKCIVSVNGCAGVKLSQQTAWTISRNPAVGGGGKYKTIKSNASGLCLDVKDTVARNAAVVLWSCNGSTSQVWNLTDINNIQYTLAAGTTNLCATVDPQAPRGTLQVEKRKLSLQPCDRRSLQQFSNTDGQIAPPR
jgi:hypothetical protein